MRYAIIEDEELARNSLRFTIEKIFPQYELDYECGKISDAVAYLKGAPDIDLVFLDIELADGNCFEIFKEVNVDIPIIFTTSYQEYAIQAFKVHSIDYLLKPFSEADLSLAIAKYVRLKRQTAPDYGKLSQAALAPKRIRIESGDNYKYVNLDEVAYFSSEDKYVLVKLKSGREYITGFANLQDVEDYIASQDFFRLSRNAIASIESVMSVSKFFRGRLMVKLSSGRDTTDVIVSQNRKEDFLNWLGR